MIFGGRQFVLLRYAAGKRTYPDFGDIFLFNFIFEGLSDYFPRRPQNCTTKVRRITYVTFSNIGLPLLACPGRPLHDRLLDH